MPKKTDKQSRIDHLSEKHPAIASLHNAIKSFNKTVDKISKPLKEQNELSELINSKTEFNPHGDYSIIYHNGTKHKLTPMQANIISFMVKEHKSGKEEVFDVDIFKKISTEQSNMTAIFKKTDIMNNVIKRVYNNYYKLDV